MRLSSAIIAIGLACPDTAPAADARPPQIRICVQLVEVPHPLLTELMAGESNTDPALHDKVMALAKSGTAKLVESSLLTVTSGKKATVESIREAIYPTEFSPPALPCSPYGGSPIFDPDAPLRIGRPVNRYITAYETRFTGVTLEIEPTADAGGKFVRLRVMTDIVDPAGLVTWSEHRDRWGDTSTRMPRFESWRNNLPVTLSNGRFTFINTFTPKPTAQVPAVTRKILCFIRAEIISR